MITVLFAFSIAFISAETTTSNPTATRLGEDPIAYHYETNPSSFFACRGPQKNLTGQFVTGPLTRRAPTRDRAGNSTLDFFKLVQKRTEEYIYSNLDLSEHTEKCFSSTKVRIRNYSNTPDCVVTQHWANPNQYPPPAGQPATEYKNSLFYAIEQARLNLALASSRVNASTALTINRELQPHGYKSVDWSPLSSQEATEAESFITQNYRRPFIEKYELTDSQMDLVTGKKSPQRDSPYPDPRNFDPETVKRESLKSELSRQMNRVRQRHLDVYRSIVAEYPIINYLSSSRPTATELATAARKLKENAKKEHDEIKALGEDLDKMNHTQSLPPKFNRLMQYKRIVEEVLIDHPEYCAVATTAQGVQTRRNIHHAALVVAPMMAAAFIAPPMVAMAGAFAAGGAFAGHSYQGRSSAIQGAYNTPIDDGFNRSNQNDVDEANRLYRTDLALIPTSVLGFGVFTKGRQLVMSKLGTR